jgi:hypothetical protein
VYIAAQETHNIPVDIMHTIRPDAMLPEDLLLTRINISQTNIHQFLQIEELVLVVLEPAEDVFSRFLGETGQEGDRHTVDVAGVGRLGGVDVGVCID